MTLQKFLKNKQGDIRSSNMAALLILQEILQSHSLLMSRNFKTKGCQWYGVNGFKSIFANKENSGTRFRGPPYCLNAVSLQNCYGRVVSRAGLFGSFSGSAVFRPGSGLKLTKMSALIRA